MKQLYLLLVLFCALPSLAVAQSNHKPGYVVTTPGDTLHGFINQMEWNINPKSISFKKTLDENSKQEFTPLTAAFFRIDGAEAYQHYNGRISLGQADINWLSAGLPDTTTMQGNVFLKVVQQGANVSLFAYTDKLKTRYFIQNNQAGAAEELIFRKYTSEVHGNVVNTQPIYKGQLLLLASIYSPQNANLNRRLEKINYIQKDLLYVTSVLNGMSEADILEAKGKVVQSRLFAGVALNQNTLRFVGRHEFARAEHASHSLLPRVNLGMDVYKNAYTKRLLFRLELSFLASQHQFYKETKMSPLLRKRSYSLSQQTASFTPQIIYNVYNTERFKAFVGAGFAINTSHYSKNNHTVQHTTPSLGTESAPVTNYNYHKLLPFWASFPVKAGVVILGNMEVFASYTFPTYIHDNDYYSLQIRSSQVGVNYLFNK